MIKFSEPEKKRRFILGKAPRGWIVLDKLKGWIRAWFATKEEAQEIADRCERGEEKPPDASSKP